MRKKLLAFILLFLPLIAFCASNDTPQTELNEQDYDYMKYVGYDYYITERNRKYGVVYKNKQIIEPLYDKIEKIFQENKYIIVEKNGKKGLFRGKKQISPVIYDDITNIKTYNKKIGAFLLKEGEKYGVYTDCLYKNKNGYYHNRKIAVPIVYDEITFYQQKSPRDNIFAMGFIVKTNDKYGYYDIQMGEILPPKYSTIVAVDYDDNVVLALKKVFFIFETSETKKIFSSKVFQKKTFWSKLTSSCRLPWNKNRCKAVKK